MLKNQIYPDIWQFEPRWDENHFAPYGNVSDISERDNTQRLVDQFSISLFIRRGEKEWAPAVSRLQSWRDFIWSDDDFPWVTQTGGELLKRSGLTGFDLTPTFLTDIEGYDPNVVTNIVLPLILRFEVVGRAQSESSKLDAEIEERPNSEIAPSLESWDGSDYFLVIEPVQTMFVTQNALDWLNLNDWGNFTVTNSVWSI